MADFVSYLSGMQCVVEHLCDSYHRVSSIKKLKNLCDMKRDTLFVENRPRQYRRYQGMNNNFIKLDGSKVAAQRMKIIRFYEKYGEKATIEAFGRDRKVVNRWKKRLKDMGGKLIALVPLSTRPKRVRKSTILPEIIEFIKTARREQPRLGKERIKPLLDEYCTQKGMRRISESTIGNIIKRHHLCFQQASTNHNLQNKRAEVKEKCSEDSLNMIKQFDIHSVYMVRKCRQD
jgi:hypothetical protein